MAILGRSFPIRPHYNTLSDVLYVSYTNPRYWVGGTGNWDAATTTNWSLTSGGAGGASVPTSANDVVFDSASNATAYTVTISASATCLGIYITNPASGAVTISGGSSLDVYGNFAINSAITYNRSGALNFRATSGINTIKTNSIPLTHAVTFNGAGGTFKPLGTMTLDSSLTLTAGIFDANSQLVSFRANSSNPVITGSFTGTSAFYNLTLTSNAGSLVLAGNIDVTGTFTSTGNSASSRKLISSSVLGTPRTITAANIVASYTDFMDITGAGAGNWNLTAQATNFFGDCQGNTGITFTTAADQHWVAAGGLGGNWSTASNWTNRCPLPQDNVFFDYAFGTSQTITVDVYRMGKTIDFTGATWTTSLTLNTGIIPPDIFGGLVLVSGITFVATNTTTLYGRGSYLLTSNGTTIDKHLSVNMFGGTLTLGSDLLMGSTKSLTLLYGTLTTVNGASNYAMSVGNFSLTNSNSAVLTLGSATHLITGTGNAWVYNSSNGTINRGTSTIKFTNTSNTAITFFNAGTLSPYYNVWFDRGASTASNTITGSNTFNDFKDTGAVAHSILFTTGTTQTVTTFTVSGTAGNAISINSTTTGTHTLTKSGGGIISCDYLNIQHSIATPASTWYAGTNSVNNQGVATAGSGWIFSAPLTTYSVTKSLGYKIRLTSSSITKSLRYATKSPVAPSKSMQYTIKTTATSVTKSTKYTVRITPAAKTKSLVYDVRTPASITKTLKYCVRTTTVAVTKSIKYAVRISLSSLTKSMKYCVRITPAVVTKSLTYKIKPTSSLTKSLSYKIKTVLSITKSVKYSVRPSASLSKSLKYVIWLSPKAVIQKSGQYTVVTPHLVIKSLVYDVRVAQPAITKSLAYRVLFQTVDITKSLSYEIRDTQSLTKQITYSVRTFSSTSKTLSYDVRTLSSLTKQLAYTVSTLAHIVTTSVSYAVRTVASVNKLVQYYVRPTSTLTKAARYSVITSSSDTKVLAYTVRTSIAASKSLAYHIVSPSALNKSLAYAVRTNSSVTLAVRYDVVTPASISKIVSYYIKTTPALTSSLSYDVRTPQSIALQSTYCVKTLDYTSKTLAYTISRVMQPLQKPLQYEVYVFPYKNRCDDPYEEVYTTTTDATSPYSQTPRSQIDRICVI